MKLFLIDAYALIYRSYYAFIKNPRVNSKGMNTSAIFGFVNTLQDVINKENPTHIAVAFDSKGKTFRHEVFEEYKAHREETPEDIRNAIPYIKKILEAYNIPIIEVPGYEADDIIGTISKRAEKEGFNVFMFTPDKDYAQLTTDKIYLFRPKLGFSPQEILNADGVKNKYHLQNPKQMIDYLALVGDTADNIPGCPGVGDKTAIKLLSEWQSIENIIANVDNIKGKLGEKIKENTEQIESSKFLATININVPIEFVIDEFIIKPLNEVYLNKIFNELEFRNLKERIIKQNQQELNIFSNIDDVENNIEEYAVEKKEINDKNLKDYQYKYEIVSDIEDIKSLVIKLSKYNQLSISTLIDNEENPTEASLAGISLCVTQNEAFYIPLPLKDRQKSIDKLNCLLPLVSNNDIEKIGQNIKTVLIVLKNYDIIIEGEIFDNTLAHYLINPEISHSIEYMAETILSYKLLDKSKLLEGIPKKEKNIAFLAPEEIFRAICEEADINLQLYHILKEDVNKNGLNKLLYNIELPLTKVLASMEEIGVVLDKEILQKSVEEMNMQLLQLEKNIHEQAECEFNVNSPKQIGEILFDKLQLTEKPKKTRTGQYNTSEEVLTALKNTHPIVNQILEYRGLKKLLSTYIEALPKMVSKKDGRLHTSYNQTVTATGRLSSSNPNLQNIPIREKNSRAIREAFTVKEGCVFLSADYSQIELRLLAHMSKDEYMIEAFKNNIDIHAATASKIYKITLDEVTSQKRNKAKTANFGIIYGISAFGLSQRLDVPRSEAKELIDDYFESYPSIKNFIKKSIEKVQENLYAETLLGRKRFLPDIVSRNGVVRGFAERNAVNAPIQGTAADIIKLAMVKIQKRLNQENLATKMIMQIHDELNFEVPENELEIVIKIVVDEMQNVIDLSVPLTVEYGVGKNWLEAH